LEKLPDIRYPSIQTIRKVYQALCDHIQVAAGTGEEHLFAFDLNEFVRLFRMNVFEVIYSIETMDQEGILERSEQVFQPSKVWFTINREGLEYAEAQHPDLEPLTKALLRTYGGIWDQPTSISEYQLARILRASVAEIQKALTTLTAMGTIKYEPRKETPQIRLLQNRVKAEDLYINPERYLERKQAFVKRIQAMVRFISSKEQCRTQLLCDYFGDKVEVCGICDVCRQQKKSADKQLAATVEERIKKLLQKTARPATELRGAFAEEEHPHFLQVLSAMEAEGLVYIDAEGRIALK
jgi:ATP-dependent DNA helicase RecQ